MRFSIIDNSSAISRRFSALRGALKGNSKKAMLAAVLQGRTIIAQRTSKGVDVNGRDFIPYSKAYSAFRKKAGRSERPNLTFSGRMLANMQVKANSRKGEIFFSRSEEGMKAAFNNERRRFFDLSRGELDRVRDVYFRRMTG
jgi:hypothetical protein